MQLLDRKSGTTPQRSFFSSPSDKNNNDKNIHDNHSHDGYNDLSPSPSPSSHPFTRTITYLTDVEGDGAYLDRFVRQSRVLTFREISPRFGGPVHDADNQHHDSGGDDGSLSYFPYSHCIDFTVDNAILVFGGDVWDKGGSDLYVIRQLLDLHRRYGPERVYWCFGNRDTNKMRILQELGIFSKKNDESLSSSSRTLPLHHGVYWKRPISSTPAATPDVGTVASSKPTSLDSNTHTTTLVPDDAADRLKWILANTMGSPRAFELRRQELYRERLFELAMDPAVSTTTATNSVIPPTLPASGTTPDTASTLLPGTALPPIVVTDQDVVESYRQSCHPKGELGQYLSKGHLIIRMGEVLFLHGALPITHDMLLDLVARSSSTTTTKTSHITKEELSSVWQDFRFAMPWKQYVVESLDNQHDIPISIDDWVIELNQFAKNCVANWKDYVHDCENADKAAASTSTTPSKSSSLHVEDCVVWSTEGGYSSTNPNAFTNLIQYAQAWLPGGIDNPTIVYSSFCSTSCMPIRLAPHDMIPTATALDRAYRYVVQDFFHQSGIRLIVCGHQPQGDTILPIRIESKQQVQQQQQGDNIPDNTDEADQSRTTKRSYNWILCCDTSYSGDTLWRQSRDKDSSRTNLGMGNDNNVLQSFRGDHAVCEVLIEQCQSSGAIRNVQYHGVLSDGSRYESSLPLLFLDNNGENNACEDWIGTLAPSSYVCTQLNSPPNGDLDEHWWVKAKLNDQNQYLIATGVGYDVWNRVVSLPKIVTAEK